MLIGLAGQFAHSLEERLGRSHDLARLDELIGAGCEGEAEILVTRGKLRVDEALLARLRGLRLIVKAGSGLDNIDLDAARRRGINVTATGGSERSVAEMVFALLFACLRHIPAYDRAVRVQDWGVKEALVGGTVSGRRLGIIGFGAIGREVAALAAALGMAVAVYDRSPGTADKARAASASGAQFLSSLEVLFASVDVLTVHVPLSAATRGLIGGDLLDRLPPGVVLINTARADVIDRTALLRALATGRVGAAGLDVHYQEYGAAADPLFALPNVILTPHAGAQTHHAHALIAERVVQAVERFAASRARSGQAEAPAGRPLLETVA